MFPQEPKEQTYAAAEAERPDGTVRWLSVRALLNPQVVGETLSLRWGPGKELAPWQPASGVSVLRVREEVGRVHVDTGVLSVEVPHGQPSALGIVKREGRTTVRGALRAAIEEGEGPHFVQGPPDLVRVERAGVVHAQVLVEGNYLRNDRPASALGDHVYRYRYRLCFHAGLPVIRVEHTVVQQCGISADRRLRRSSIRVARIEGEPGFQIDHRRVTRLHQTASGVCEIEGEEHELRFTGVGTVSGALTAGVRDFWERYPKAIERRDRDLDIHLLDDSKSETVCAQGEAQTHELWLWFGHDAPSPPDFAELLRRPPLLRSRVSLRAAHDGHRCDSLQGGA